MTVEPRHAHACWYEVESDWHCVPECPVDGAAWCHCGQRLHYTDPLVEAAVRDLVRVYGPYVVVETPAGAWRVQRHYIGLHGLKAEDLPRLGFERIATARGPVARLLVSDDG